MSFTPPNPHLKATPDWGGAAQALLDGCAHLPSALERVEFLDGCSRALGTQLYPAFLQVLLIIAHRGTALAQQHVADAMADAMACGRLPCGSLLAWGQESRPTAITASSRPPARHQALGPLEYLFANFAQPTSPNEAISAVALEDMLIPLMRLFAQSPRAHVMYCARLMDIAQAKLDGGWTRDTKSAVTALATQWHQHPHDPRSALSALLNSWTQREHPNATQSATRAVNQTFGRPDFFGTRPASL